MRTLAWIVTGLLAVIFLFSCERSYEDRLGDLKSLLSGDPLGGDQDYWIEMQGGYTGQWHEVGLIFGFGSGDRVPCEEIVEDLNAREVRENRRPVYRCRAAN